MTTNAASNIALSTSSCGFCLMRSKRIADRTQRAFDPPYPTNRPACAYLIRMTGANRNRVALLLSSRAFSALKTLFSPLGADEP